MATRTVVCPECEEPLAQGRLSCTSCGSLLASVAGATPRPTPLRTVTIDESPSLSDDTDVPPADANGSLARHSDPDLDILAPPQPDAGSEPRADALDTLAAPETSPEVTEPPEATELTASAPDPASEEEPHPEDGPADDPSWVDVRLAAVREATAAAAAPAAVAPDPEPEPELDPEGELEPELEPGVVEPAAEGVDEPEADAFQPADTGTDETVGAPGDADDAAEPPPPDPAPARPEGGRAFDESADGTDTTVADSFLQPSSTTSSRHDLWSRPDAVAPASWELEADAAPARPGSWVPPTPVAEVDLQPQPAARSDPARASFFADLPFNTPRDVPSWLGAIGGALATLGFLLPWSSALPFADGWTERWGLAVASHGLVLLASIVLLGLNVVPNRMAPWLRAGALPLALGGLLVGLVWPYILAGGGAQVGGIVIAIAAFALLAGGTIGVRRAQHRTPAPAV